MRAIHLFTIATIATIASVLVFTSAASADPPPSIAEPAVAFCPGAYVQEHHFHGETERTPVSFTLVAPQGGGAQGWGLVSENITFKCNRTGEGDIERFTCSAARAPGDNWFGTIELVRTDGRIVEARSGGRLSFAGAWGSIDPAPYYELTCREPVAA
jgi:hypothetical protein